MKSNYSSKKVYSLGRSVSGRSHSLPWWSVKVICGAVLIASLFLMVLYQVPALFYAPTWFAQTLVILGGFISIYHYLLLKRTCNNISVPANLIRDKALFKWIRHPMYGGDMLAYTGLFLLMPNWVTLVVLVIAFVALIRQAIVEDDFLAARFGSDFTEWASRTSLILPRLF